MQVSQKPTKFPYNGLVNEAMLRTKLFIPPSRPDLVPRQRLIDRLNQGLQTGRKLTLVSAPAGFGKTTLVSNWIQQCGQPAAWLSLDEGDNEAIRFLYYMVAALREANCELGNPTLSLLQSPQPPDVETILTLTINDLTLMESRVILVFDDYHVIQEMDIHRALTFLLDNQPPQLHVVIISRSDPAFPLHRLRGSGQMTGLYIEDLRFNSAEVASFLIKTMGLSLSPEESDTLAQRTEGWVAGLQLAALSMQGMPNPSDLVSVFAADDRHISDYLVGEVFERQPAEIREFLLKTAILERFSAPLCDALLGSQELGPGIGKPSSMPSSEAIIERLDHSNLFIIALDNKREWYRYHHLFAEFLRLRQRQTSADETAELHRRAAEWFEDKEFRAEAINHALAGEDFQRASRLIEQNALTTIFGLAQWATLFKWMEALPEEMIRTRPVLSVQYAWALHTTGHWEAAANLIEEIKPTIESAQRTAERDLLLGELSIIASMVAYSHGDMNRTAEEGRQALLLLPKENLSLRCVALLSIGESAMVQRDLLEARQYLQQAADMAVAAGNISIVLFALGDLARLEIAEGNLHRAAELYRMARQSGTVQGNTYLGLTGIACMQMGEVLYEWNQLDEAKTILKEGLALCRGLAGLPNIMVEGQVNLVRILLASGDEKAAAETMEEVERLLSSLEERGADAQPIISVALAGRLRYWLTLGMVNEAAMWLDENAISVDTPVSTCDLAYHVLLARVLVEQGHLEKARRQLDRLAMIERERASPRLAIEISVLWSLWLQENGDEDQAIDMLSEALRLAEPEGFIRLFVEYGQSLRHLLRKAAELKAASENTRQILALMTANQPIIGTRPAEAATLMEPLKDQELRILRLIAAGLTNREIAAELFLSINTIKTYTSRIYGKLGVHNRAEAVSRAHDLDIM